MIMPRESVETEIQAGFAAKLSRIGARQGTLLSHLTRKLGRREHLPIEEIAEVFQASGNELYYRLEHLRLLGFLRRIALGESDGAPIYGWTLSDQYRRDIGSS